ncbi:Protein of unknown function [Selenomonas ruminantium]|uniref:DUF3375 domain-containing protein n=1 Tax=Selenomonas ruminantium TaxID=971 RepID=A0A1I3DRD0_SELRU|nr:DUF3375 domain-containing protein [Selenomonas ruminantium]SFH89099.1 Protein of unknown function [Selenomonas ruminantium]
MVGIPDYMDYDHLRNLRMNHAAWRLLRADQAAFIAAFFYREFIAGKRRGIEAQELLEHLDLFLYDAQRQTEGEAFGRSPQDYLEIWSDSDHGWLRKYEYHDEWYYDLTAPAQKAVEWLVSLHKQDFVGTESRLRTVFNLLHEIARETDTDAEHRKAYLLAQQEKIAAELAEIEQSGVVKPRLDEVQVKERFLQAEDTAQAILADFREVEENFRELTRKVQDDVVKWTRGKGELLEKIFSESDIIRKSEQGRSFMAFWRYLMLSQQQEDFRTTMAQISEAASIRELLPDHPLASINREWVRAAGSVQQTLAQLSAQLRRYVDEAYLQEERTIYQLIQRIETQALERRDDMPAGEFTSIRETAPAVQLPMERRLYAPPQATKLVSPVLQAGSGDDGELTAIFDQVIVDRKKLQENIEELLAERPEVTLAEVLAVHPLQQGLPELLGYLVLASHAASEAFDSSALEHILFERDGHRLMAVCDRVVFWRNQE